MTDDNVIDLNERRVRPTLDTCTCGSTWWIAKVVIENDRVTGYTDVVCNECGQNR